MKREHYRLGLKYLKKTVKKGEGIPGRTAYYSYFHEKKLTISTNTACHAGLYAGSAKGCLGVINCLVKNYDSGHGPGEWSDTTDEEKIMFLDWLARRSPYKTAFVSKKATKILERGAALLTSEAPGNVLGGACVSMRRLWEHTIVLQVWCDLVKAGVGENLAYVLGHLAAGSRDKGLNWGNFSGWHVAINSRSWTTGQVKNFVEGNLVGVTKKYSESGDYNDYSMYLFKAPGGNLRFIHEEFPYSKPQATTNPFHKAVDNGVVTMNYDDAIATMSEFQQHILKVCEIKV